MSKIRMNTEFRNKLFNRIKDVFEKEEYLEKVRKAYLNLEGDSLVRIIDATRTPEKIFDEVWKLVSEVRNG